MATLLVGSQQALNGHHRRRNVQADASSEEDSSDCSSSDEGSVPYGAPIPGQQRAYDDDDQEDDEYDNDDALSMPVILNQKAPEEKIEKTRFEVALMDVDFTTTLAEQQALNKTTSKLVASLANNALEPVGTIPDCGTPEEPRALIDGILIQNVAIGQIIPPDQDLIITFKQINALPKERTGECVQIRVTADQLKLATKQPVEILDRGTPHGRELFFQKHKGLVAQQVRSTYEIPLRHPQDVRMHIDSPLVEKYEQHDLVRSGQLKSVAEMSHKCDELGYVLLRGAAKVVKEIAPLVEKSMKENLPMSCLSSKEFSVEFSLPMQKLHDAKTNRYETTQKPFEQCFLSGVNATEKTRRIKDLRAPGKPRDVRQGSVDLTRRALDIPFSFKMRFAFRFARALEAPATPDTTPM